MRTLTGLDVAGVPVKDAPTATVIQRGQELPPNMVDGEEQRLEQLGAFAPHTHAERVRALDSFRRQAAKRSEALSANPTAEAMAEFDAWVAEEMTRLREEELL
jgi:hypothetical protein